jgi:hypothetical protein
MIPGVNTRDFWAQNSWLPVKHRYVDVFSSAIYPSSTAPKNTNQKEKEN